MQNFESPGPRPAADLMGQECLGQTDDCQHVLFKFQGREEFVDHHGLIHEGFLASMLVEVMASTANFAAGDRRFASMISMSADFIKSVQPGLLAGKGAITLMGKNIVFIEGLLFFGEQLVARATGSCRLLNTAYSGWSQLPELRNH